MRGGNSAHFAIEHKENISVLMQVYCNPTQFDMGRREDTFFDQWAPSQSVIQPYS
jgi:hypothetical protein